MLNYKINKYKTQIINDVYLNILISFFKLLQSTGCPVNMVHKVMTKFEKNIIL